jgi:hypothetical protein
VRRVDGLADATLDFDAQRERVHEVFAARVLPLAERQDRRGDRSGRVDDRLEMGIVVVEHVRGDAVQQGGMHDVEALAPAEHGRLRLAREFGQRGHGPVGRDVARAAQAATDPVEHGTHRFVARAIRNVCPSRVHDVARELAGGIRRGRRLAVRGRAAGQQRRGREGGTAQCEAGRLDEIAS